jgi:hypothetical protein
MGRQCSPRVTSLPRISTSSYLESNRRLSRGCSSVITTVATAPATAPRKLVCSIWSSMSAVLRWNNRRRNASIADLPRVETAWWNPGELVARGDVKLAEDLSRSYCAVRGRSRVCLDTTAGRGSVLPPAGQCPTAFGL